MLHRSLGEEIVLPSRQMMTKKALHIGQQVTKKSKQSKGWNEIRSKILLLGKYCFAS